ncbi:hypothetical protein Tco_0945594 [Tanacetum coccineum]
MSQRVIWPKDSLHGWELRCEHVFLISKVGSKLPPKSWINCGLGPRNFGTSVMIDDSATEHKKVLPRKMNEYHRKFKTNLTHIAQEGKDPLLVYKDLNMEDWPEFVSIRNSPAFMEKSAKAKANALKNTDRHKMGQTSYVRLEKMLAPIMQDSKVGNPRDS